MSLSGDPELLSKISEATVEAIRLSEIYLPPDVKAALVNAKKTERSEIARRELDNILENIRLAEERSAPLCQDTGVPIIYCTLPPDVSWTQDIENAILQGVIRATYEIPLRPNLVDPISRHNTGTNTGLFMPDIHVEYGDKLLITALPKGAGSENVSRIKMFTPSEKDQIEKFIVETVLLAGGRPCPPVILGVGIGGTFDGAPALAKKALLDPIDKMSDQEEQVFRMINLLGIGPMGLGGDTTCLAVKIRAAGCHTASLPVAVNIQCWASRHATVEVKR